MLAIGANGLLPLQAMALEAIVDAVLITDADGLIVWANHALAGLTGFTADEAIGQTPRIFRSGRQDRTVYDELWATVRSGRVWRGRLLNRRKDGSVYSEEQTITPVTDEDGRPTHFIAIKRAPEGQAHVAGAPRGDALFRVLLENSLDIAAVLNADGSIRYQSPSVTSILGYAPGELEGQSVFAFVPEGHADRVKSAIGADRPSDATGTIEVAFRHRDGSWRLLEASCRSMLADPTVAGVLVNARDITQRRLLEEEMARQREVRLQGDKLADMGMLLAGVAHELNNPLTVITGYCTILKTALGTTALGARVEKMTVAAERCARIVRNFLALARQQPAERRAVGLNQIVREAVELVAYPLRIDNVDVCLELGQDLPTLCADSHQIHQVVVNLITNAHHAMRDSVTDRRLTVRTSFESAACRVFLEVGDTGPGVPAAIEPRIFEPFFTTKPLGQGTGLGLPLCRGIVEGHGGTIRHVRRPGHGAAFVLELPVEPAPVWPERAVIVAAKPALRGCSILVVDDEPDVVGVLADLLKADGVRIDTASDGRLALERLSEADYDLIVCDVRMPGIDGPALYRALQERRPELLPRIVFLTGDTLNPDSEAFVRRTRAQSLTKPFDIGEVRRVIGEALARR